MSLLPELFRSSWSEVATPTGAVTCASVELTGAVDVETVNDWDVVGEEDTVTIG